MRGGSQTDIGPGNAGGSRPYHRLVGTAFGTQMPPAGPLSDEKVEIIQHWIDEGAVWPDAASGETAPLAVDPDATRLDGVHSKRRSARHRLAAPEPSARRDVAGALGATPLMAAALYGDAALVRRLLGGGADPNAADTAGVTPLMWALPDVGKMQALLDAGAERQRAVRRSALRARHHRRHRWREAGAEAAARLRRRPVALESRRSGAAARSRPRE